MIGIPQQTVQGLIVRSLLNSKIKAGGQIQIDNESAQQKVIKVPSAPTDYVPSLNARGFYKVLSVVHSSDTGGSTSSPR